MFTMLSLPICEHSMPLHLFVFFDMKKCFLKILLFMPVCSSVVKVFIFFNFYIFVVKVFKVPCPILGRQLGTPENPVCLCFFFTF